MHACYCRYEVHTIHALQHAYIHTTRMHGYIHRRLCIHNNVDACMHAYITLVHACMHTYINSLMHACMHAYHTYHACMQSSSCIYIVLHDIPLACIHACIGMHACMFAIGIHTTHAYTHAGIHTTHACTHAGIHTTPCMHKP